METLHVKDFLVIKEAKFDIRKINIIIGSQANGKSIIAKLIYLFSEVCGDILLKNIDKKSNEEDYISDIKTLFGKYFPRYGWRDKAFSIQYIHDNFEVYLSKNAIEEDINVELSDDLKEFHADMVERFKEFSKDKDKILENPFRDFKMSFISNKEFLDFFGDSIFIPAGRSFFVTLQKNIFSLLSGDINLDPIVKKFGSRYESAKSVYYDDLFNEFKKSPELYKKAQKITEEILVGKYINKNNEDWIQTRGESVKLQDVSSGQQESLPMMLIMLIYGFYPTFSNVKTFFIEEPEAHLFPISQKHIVSLIALLYNVNNKSVITTHSPYILTALNNLILANDVKKKGKNIKDIIDEDLCVNFDDVSAYTIKDGKLKSIIDTENRLLGINIIDSVSDEFNDTFDGLLSLLD